MIVLREKHIAGFVDFVHRGRLIQRRDPFWLACFRLEQVKSKTKTVIFLWIILLRSSVPSGKPYRDCCVFFFLVRVFRIEHTNFRFYRNCIVYFSPLFVGRISRRWLFRISWNVQVFDNTLRCFSFHFFLNSCPVFRFLSLVKKLGSLQSSETVKALYQNFVGW